MGEGAAARGEKSPRELVVGHVRRHRVAKPGVVLVRTPFAELSLCQPQKVAPLERPERRVLGSIQECVDQLRAPV